MNQQDLPCLLSLFAAQNAGIQAIGKGAQVQYDFDFSAAELICPNLRSIRRVDGSIEDGGRTFYREYTGTRIGIDLQGNTCVSIRCAEVAGGADHVGVEPVHSVHQPVFDKLYISAVG